MSEQKGHMDEMASQLFQTAREEYKFVSLEIRNRQTAIQAQYFWVAFGFITVYGAVFQGVFTDKPFYHLGLLSCLFEDQASYVLLFKILVTLVFTLCAWTVVTGIDGLRGRGTSGIIFGKFSPYSNLKAYLENSTTSYIDDMLDLLTQVQEVTDRNLKEALRMGRHLRQISTVLVCAMIIGIVTFLI